MPLKEATLDSNETHEMPIEDALELARGHHINGNFVLAERTYKDILKVVPDNPTVNHLLGALYFQLGIMDKSIDYMKKSIDIAPDETQYWSNYGSALSVINEHNEAIHWFDKVLKENPDNLEALNKKSMALWQQEHYEEAYNTAKISMQIAPLNLDGLINAGIALANMKRYEEATTIWQNAAQHYPNDTRIFSNWSNMAREMKKYTEAESIARKAIEINPKNPEALNNLGCTLRELGKIEDSIDAFEKATYASPKYYQAHYNKALALLDIGRFEKAAIAARYAIAFNEQYAEAYNALGIALCETGNFEEAHLAAQHSIQIRPDAASYIALADVLYMSSSFDDGHAALRESLNYDKKNPETYNRLSSVYERLNEFENAMAAIDKAIEIAPHMPLLKARKACLLHINNDTEACIALLDEVIEVAPYFIAAYGSKAEALIAINKKTEALAAIKKAQEINPSAPHVYYTLAGIKKFEDPNDPDLIMLLSLKDTALAMGLNHSSSLNFGIAKAYEDLKQYDKSFEYYKLANKERRAVTAFDREYINQMFANVKELYSPEFLAQLDGHGYESEKPVFIVGMPRSGTTLTEQILACHPDVYGAGELPDITHCRRTYANINPEILKEMGETYVNLSSKRDPIGQAKRITDKMPGNYIYLGLIAKMLPNAKIIHCRRNPIDTCLSNFTQNFSSGQPWSFSLEEIGEEFLRYKDLMAYWHTVLPGRILDIDYEETVDNFEEQARKLINFIGLEWNDACLKPHKQKRSILTASKMQVTQPIYKTSIHKWKRYEKELQPLIKIIDPSQAFPD
jgi:tetratricopeptide (TPR) repeat protein